MGRYRMKITLLSDLCVSDGGVYNSSLDTDICYDEFGFPYIPAKRLKGCLRECALELNDWGKKIPIEEIFGGKDSKVSALRLGNAYLEGYDTMRAEVLKYRNSLVCHPQNVLNHFSYVRTQTSIDYDTGVADDTTLRTIRVANKGLVFIAEADLKDTYWDALSACCDIFKSMGIARTRGLGEIEVILDERNLEAQKDLPSEPAHVPWVEGADCLTYTIRLEEPLICKSVNGGESRTVDYIEGSKILGLIAQKMKDSGSDIVQLLEQGEIFCSNAYIEYDGKRMLEVPATFYSVKNDKTRYVDKIYETEKEHKEEQEKKRQLNQMKHCYITFDQFGGLIKCGVDIEDHYHHRRPDDKSVGRAYDDDSGDSTFYQMSSITRGQVFQGYITGSSQQIKEIYQLLFKIQKCNMGYSRSAEYGKVHFRITEVSQKEKKVWNDCKNFMVKLEAPTIIYGPQAMYSTDAKELIAEINALLEIEEDEVDKYINYTTVGGYNVTWNARKPVIETFDKGTVLHYQLKQPVKELPSVLLLGERVAEGFGEATITPVDKEEKQYERQIIETGDAKKNPVIVDVADSVFLKSICNDLFRTFVDIEAVQAAKQKDIGNGDKKETLKPTVSNLILMCKESSNLGQMELSIEDRFQKKSELKNNKLREARKILEEVRKNSAVLLEDFCDRYKILNYSYDKDACECAYMTSYLNELKYRFRKVEQNK